MASSIGIKIANGEFYPVVEEGSTIKKRLILTTVHDGQNSVQIDLYRSATKSMTDAAYIGSLVVEDIAPKRKGDPSIELVIGADGNQEVSAEAIDLDPSAGGDRQKLTVSLQALNEEERSYEMPDFELESDSQPPSALYEKHEELMPEPERKSVPVVLYVLLSLAAAIVVFFLLWFFVFRRKPAPAPVVVVPVVDLPVTVTPPVVEPPVIVEPVKPVEVVVEPPKPVIVAETPVVATVEPAPVPAKRVRPPAPVKSYKIPSVIPKEGFRYKIRWGDTLWDIAEAFYRNPWLYPKIARFNKIKNPDLIISGRYLLVPPKK